MYAAVIVDVPAKQTDRPFDYAVPIAMQDWIEIGSRVGVPFGARVVQGFVIELKTHAEVEEHKLKEITHILDTHPPLTRELIQLSEWIAHKYVCPVIAALQAMIPGALKAKYERHIRLGDLSPDWSDYPIEGRMRGDDDRVGMRQIIRFVQEREMISSEVLLMRFPERASLIKAMIKQGSLVEQQSIKDRLSTKSVLTVVPASDSKLLMDRLNDLPASATRQKELLQYFLANPSPIKLSELLQQLELSSGSVRSLADKGCLTIEEVEVFRDPFADRKFSRSEALVLTDQQQVAFRQVSDRLAEQVHRSFLLYGVTGSGKTEIYLQAIAQVIDQGREAIVLVPEISLTPQMVERFKGRFGDLVAVLHSRLSQGERYDEWRKIQLGTVKVAIGARSAVFAPFTNLGLIIIDEEHESSYKQEDSPKYQTRDVAIQRGKSHHAVVLLGSATPSLETIQKTRDKQIELLTMRLRVEGRPLPEVEIIDMREELKAGNRTMFSRRLHEAIGLRLERQEQMVLLLNRRGYSTFVLCRSCGYVAQCPHCDISLTYHRQSHSIRCHYCGYTDRELAQCPQCESEHIRYFGTGTQRVEEELSKLFPGIRVIRMDVDTTREKGAHEKWLNQFRDRRADVLLGTQMVAKGLDFPHVTLVGVIAADTVLGLPDFRAAEKTFQLLTQVAGRAGRHELPGEVVIQTYNPDHYSIRAAGTHDYRGFVQAELSMRKERGYPPYCELILITLSHEQVQLPLRAGELLVTQIQEGWKSLNLGATAFMEVLGPVVSPIARTKDRYRFQCMVKYRGDSRVVEVVRQAIGKFDEMVNKQQLQISVDVDPQVMS